MSYSMMEALQDVSDADEYERARQSRARLAYRRGLINTRELDYELFEATREANDMRGAVIRKLIA